LRKRFLLSEFAHSFAEVLLNLRFTPFIHLGDQIILDDNKSTDFKYLMKVLHKSKPQFRRCALEGAPLDICDNVPYHA
jgi:hypothetical protein